MAESVPTSPSSGGHHGHRRRVSVSDVAHSVVSATESVFNSDLPPGFFAATAEATSRAPTWREMKRGDWGNVDGSRKSGSQSRTSNHKPHGLRESSRTPSHEHVQHSWNSHLKTFTPLNEKPSGVATKPIAQVDTPSSVSERRSSEQTKQEYVYPASPLSDNRAYESDYTPPPKPPWTTTTIRGLKEFWRWFLTPFGFLVTIYGLNVVAWGGMLFLLILNVNPSMCWISDGHGGKIKECNNQHSPRKAWIEWDSQILNALFCVTGFGLAPWRFRDLYHLLRFRITSEQKHGLDKKMIGLRKLGGHYRSWLRLPGSDTLSKTSDSVIDATSKASMVNDLRIPLPVSKRPDDPLTGVRASPTALWKIDFFIWSMVWNTLLQGCLAGFMWGYNRFERPTWSTGLFVALACIVAGLGGIVTYIEGRRIKKIEGVAWHPDAAEGSLPEKDVESQLSQTQTGHESIHLGDQAKGKGAL